MTGPTTSTVAVHPRGCHLAWSAPGPTGTDLLFLGLLLAGLALLRGRR